jgi:hypothetical protein
VLCDCLQLVEFLIVQREHDIAPQRMPAPAGKETAEAGPPAPPRSSRMTGCGGFSKNIAAPRLCAPAGRNERAPDEAEGARGRPQPRTHNQSPRRRRRRAARASPATRRTMPDDRCSLPTAARPCRARS